MESCSSLGRASKRPRSSFLPSASSARRRDLQPEAVADHWSHGLHKTPPGDGFAGSARHPSAPWSTGPPKPSLGFAGTSSSAARGAAAGDEDELATPPDHAKPQVVLAACAGRAYRVGLAYVDLEAGERILHVADTLDVSFSELHRLKLAVLGGGRKHGLCVLPSKSPPALLEQAVEPLSAAMGGSSPAAGGEQVEPFPIVVMKSADFDFEPCRQRVLLVDDGALDLENEQLVRAAGGLLRFIEKNRSQLGEVDQLGTLLHGIRLFSLDNMLFVDAKTMRGLQVFQEDPHPSQIRGGRRSKEGVSLFGLLEPFVASPAGRQVLQRWLQQPSRDVKLLGERHDSVQELMASRHAELLRDLQRELQQIRDFGPLLRRIFSCYHFDNLHDWQALIASLEHMLAAFQLVEATKSIAGLPPVRNAKVLSQDVEVAAEMLERFVDVDACSDGGNTEVRVRAGVDRHLDELREQYKHVDEHLAEVAMLEQQRLVREGCDGGLAESLTFHYFPQLGFQASLPNPLVENASCDVSAAAMQHLKHNVPVPAPDWRYQFAGSGRLFYKCHVAIRLDAEIGDLVVAARELELELLLGVVERLRHLEPRLSRAAQLLAEFDVLAGFAVVAREMLWRRPRFSENVGVLKIVKGRHPLVEMCMTSHHGFVPNNTELGVPLKAEDQREDGVATAHVQVVTGANLAGKSVYLKQVGLIVLLAQVGSFVPAEDAELGLCDMIFSRIQFQESAAVRNSTFGVDLAQVSHALRYASPASLVLLDEFGKGTHAADGVALLGATVEYLCRWRAAPKAIITTHFTEIFRCQLVSVAEPGLQTCTMRVLPPEGDHGGIAYLYQLIPGVADRSFGIECARHAGMEEEVLRRAAEILAALESGDAVPPPRSGACAEAVARADELEAQRRNVANLIVDRLRSIDPEDEEAAKELLAFVWSQQSALAQS